MTPLEYLKQAKKHYPNIRLAWGLIGAAAAGAIIASFFKNAVVAAPVTVLTIAGMFVLAGLARPRRKAPATVVSTFLLWVCAMAFALALSLVLSAAAIGKPAYLAALLFEKGSAPGEKSASSLVVLFIPTAFADLEVSVDGQPGLVVERLPGIIKLRVPRKNSATRFVLTGQRLSKPKSFNLFITSSAIEHSPFP